MTYETWISGSMTPYEVVIPIILVIYILILSGYEACISESAIYRKELFYISGYVLSWPNPLLLKK